MACFHIFQIYKPYSMYPSLGERRFQHYRDQPGFALTDYHPLAANWIVLTVHRGQAVAPGCSLDLIGLFP
jgi:hypothetical protein